MDTPKSEAGDPRLCPNCGKQTGQSEDMCPNCGAPLPPLPDITRQTPTPQVDVVLLTRSRAGDIAAGIVLGMLTPATIMYGLILAMTGLPGATSSALTGVLSILFVPIVVGLPFVLAYVLKQKRHVAGNAMQKTLFAGLILIGLLFLGLLIICGVGALKI